MRRRLSVRVASMADLSKDKSDKENVSLAKEYEPKIVDFIKKNPGCSMQDIFTKLEFDDIPMYIAIHNLVTEKKVDGESPYVANLGGHSKYKYTVKQASLTERLDRIASEVEKENPHVALAIDQISDRLDRIGG